MDQFLIITSENGDVTRSQPRSQPAPDFNRQAIFPTNIYRYRYVAWKVGPTDVASVVWAQGWFIGSCQSIIYFILNCFVVSRYIEHNNSHFFIEHLHQIS